MKIHTIGTCAGTEPMPTRQHACCIFEVNGKLYCFDAGSGCSRTAWLKGLPLTDIENIFISQDVRLGSDSSTKHSIARNLGEVNFAFGETQFLYLKEVLDRVL